MSASVALDRIAVLKLEKTESVSEGRIRGAVVTRNHLLFGEPVQGVQVGSLGSVFIDTSIVCKSLLQTKLVNDTLALETNVVKL